MFEVKAQILKSPSGDRLSISDTEETAFYVISHQNSQTQTFYASKTKSFLVFCWELSSEASRGHWRSSEAIGGQWRPYGNQSPVKLINSHQSTLEVIKGL